METVTIVEDIIEARKGFKFFFWDVKPCNAIIEVATIRKPEICHPFIWLLFVHFTIVPRLWGAYKCYGQYELKADQRRKDFKTFGEVTIELDEKRKKLIHVEPVS